MACVFIKLRKQVVLVEFILYEADQCEWQQDEESFEATFQDCHFNFKNSDESQ